MTSKIEYTEVSIKGFMTSSLYPSTKFPSTTFMRQGASALKAVGVERYFKQGQPASAVVNVACGWLSIVG
jgi:hypothetical protein